MSKKTASAPEPAFTDTTAADASPVADFETSLDALEALVERMEQGQLSLEDSLAAYERSVGLYRRCQQALEQAELRVRLLSDPERPESAQPFHE
jgi:exodeoxyribonuclease VII small subunit